MLGLPPSVRIYYAVEPVDMRKASTGFGHHTRWTGICGSSQPTQFPT